MAMEFGFRISTEGHDDALYIFIRLPQWTNPIPARSAEASSSVHKPLGPNILGIFAPEAIRSVLYDLNSISIDNVIILIKFLLIKTRSRSLVN